MSEAICEEVNRRTIEQSDNLLWYELRYGRLTASKLHESAHCQTPDGTLVNEIIGASKLFNSPQMERGKRLESEVLCTLQKKTGLECYKSGLLLSSLFPVLGASPDAVGDDFIVEIKCPRAQIKVLKNSYQATIPLVKNVKLKCNYKCLWQKEKKVYFVLHIQTSKLVKILLIYG